MTRGFERAKELVERISSIGRGERGISRLALTHLDLQAREVVAQELLSLGMSLSLDGAGNLWAHRAGREDLPGVLMGSHLDSVPEGGAYDGVLGVCFAAAIARDIAESLGSHRRPLSVVIFAAEESSRFGVSCVGSKAITGRLSVMDMISYRDNQGISLLTALRRVGGRPEMIHRNCLMPASYQAFFELHIEQGPLLDRSGDDVGIVEAVAAPVRFSLSLAGEAAHSGACPMGMRRDALAAAAEVILAVEEAGRREASFHTVATVGVCRCFPGAMNVVPGRVELKVDIRGICEDSMARAAQDVQKGIAQICGARGIDFEISSFSAEKPVILDGLLAARLERICRDRGIGYRRMASGAGHDVMNVATLIPSALIFVPCRDGISHNPQEAIQWERVRAGYDVMAQVVAELIDR